MYEKKLRELFERSKQHAEEALADGDTETAAAYYRRCGDILQERGKNRRGRERERTEELAEKYYTLSETVAEKEALEEDREKTDSIPSSGPEENFSSYVERFIQDSHVTWDDVAGMEETKQQIKESFALAAIDDKPPAVAGINTVLLHGPPGTGKSLLASAVAGSHDHTFFHVKLSHALSKYYGESGKIISQLFETARERAPSVIFFDEIDAVAMARSGDLDETSRRVLSTLLTELSGFDAENDEVMFMAATNTPWDLDQALLSRMERVIYVPLPDRTTAEKIIRLNTEQEGITLDVDAAVIAEECVNRRYSGREVKSACRAAIRRMINDMNPQLDDLSEQPITEIRDYSLNTRPLQRQDFAEAFDAIDPQTDPEALQRYEEWEREQA